jgi:putative spermidine/putrescine transport system permease protein
MRFKRTNPPTGERAPFGLKLAAVAVLLFLHVPVWIILLYAFTTDSATFSFPPPGLTLDWFGVAWKRSDFWQALGISLRVAGIATALAILPGCRGRGGIAPVGRSRSLFCWCCPGAARDVIGIALRSATPVRDPFSF